MTPPGQIQRVLMTTDTVGGVWHYALELCRGLREYDVEVVLATMGPRPSPDQREAAQRLELVLCESDYRLEWMDTPWSDVDCAGDWLLELESRYAPDLVHLNGYAHAALPFRAPKLVVAHSCVCSWWHAVRGENAPPSWDRYREAVTAGLQSADFIVAPTQAMLDALRHHYLQHGTGVPPVNPPPTAGVSPARSPRIRVIPNGRAPADFPRSAAKEPFILSVGRLWDEAKNAATLAAIASDLPWPVRVAGDLTGPDGRPHAFVNLESLGRCAPTELAHIYARAAIYALPARYEPFGLSVLEAALSGCALVLGDVPSLRELWHDTALFVPPDDSRALHRALATLIAAPAQRQRLAALAHVRAHRLTAERMVARYLNTYRDLLAAPSPQFSTPPALDSDLSVLSSPVRIA